MKQRIEPYEREKIKDLLLSGDEANYKLALQLLSIFFDKREARKFIWYECLACYVVPTLIRQFMLYKDYYKTSSYKKYYKEANVKLSNCIKKWIHSGCKNSVLALYLGLAVPYGDNANKLLKYLSK